MDTTNETIHQVTEISVTYHSKVKASQRIKISRSSDAYELLLSSWDDTIELYESFKIVLLNKANKVLGISLIGNGGVSGCVVDPKRVFATALLSGCSSIILCHNHPSGTTQPSEADVKITNKIKQAGVFLEIGVLDHLIITAEGFYSFADEGTL